MTVADFTEHRGLLYAVAYRILGAVTDAEDVYRTSIRAALTSATENP